MQLKRVDYRNNTGCEIYGITQNNRAGYDLGGQRRRDLSPEKRTLEMVERDKYQDQVHAEEIR